MQTAVILTNHRKMNQHIPKLKLLVNVIVHNMAVE